jgi:hypothetical protein
MKTLCKIVGIFALALVGSGAFATTIGGPIYNPATGDTYYLLDASTWTDAESQAVELGGYLATVNDAAEDSWIYSTFSSYGGVSRNLWIGLITGGADGSVRNNYYWVNGETSTYRNWYDGQPMESIEHYTEIVGPGNFASGGWNNVQDVSSDGYSGTTLLPNCGVVEVVPEPSICGMMVLGGVLTISRMYRRGRRLPF